MEAASGSAQAVADPGFCDDVSRLGRIGFEFPAQIADVHSQQMKFVLIAEPAPDLPDDLPVSENAVGVPDEQFQNVVFRGGELNCALPELDVSPREIDCKIAG